MIITESRAGNRFKKPTVWVPIVAILAFGALREFEVISDTLFKGMLVGSVALTAIYEASQAPGKKTIFDFVERVAIGTYIPEDERDQAVKLDAAMAGFRMVMLINWITMSYYIVSGDGFTGVFEPAAWIAILSSFLGMRLFVGTILKSGVDNDLVPPEKVK